jgi:hypothetical protein
MQDKTRGRTVGRTLLLFQTNNVKCGVLIVLNTLFAIRKEWSQVVQATTRGAHTTTPPRCQRLEIRTNGAQRRDFEAARVAQGWTDSSLVFEMESRFQEPRVTPLDKTLPEGRIPMFQSRFQEPRVTPTKPE